MSRKGENIYKRKDNRWEGRYVKGYNEDGSVKYGYIYGSSYAETKERLQKARTSLALGLSTTCKTRKKMSDYIKEWLQVNYFKITESSYVKYLSVIEKHINPFFGAYKRAGSSFALGQFIGTIRPQIQQTLRILPELIYQFQDIFILI